MNRDTRRNGRDEAETRWGIIPIGEPDHDQDDDDGFPEDDRELGEPVGVARQLADEARRAAFEEVKARYAHRGSMR